MFAKSPSLRGEKLPSSPRGEFFSEGISTQTLTGINFLLGFIEGFQKLSIFLVAVCIEAESPGDQTGLERIAFRRWQTLNCGLNFLNRAHASYSRPPPPIAATDYSDLQSSSFGFSFRYVVRKHERFSGTIAHFRL